MERREFYAGDPDGWVWLFRCQIPAHRLMVGEIVRTPEGKIRVHCWSAADPGRYTRGEGPVQIIAAKEARGSAIAEIPKAPQSTPIMPPLMWDGISDWR